MSQSNKKFLNTLFRIPWWVSVVLAFCVYVGLKYIIPSMQTENVFLTDLGKSGPYFAPLAALIFLLPAPFSLFAEKEEKSNEDILISLRGIDSLRALSQQDFERLVEHVYSNLGFSVIKNTYGGPGKRAVFRFDKDGEFFIALCLNVSDMDKEIELIRELNNIVTAEQAHGGIIITSGVFSREVADFAEDKPIEMVDGTQMLSLIDSVRRDSQNEIT